MGGGRGVRGEVPPLLLRCTAVLIHPMHPPTTPPPPPRTHPSPPPPPHMVGPLTTKDHVYINPR